MRRKRDLANRETELLRKELEILRATPRSMGNESVQISMRKWQELKDLIGEFDGKNGDFDR